MTDDLDEKLRILASQNQKTDKHKKLKVPILDLLRILHRIEEIEMEQILKERKAKHGKI